MRALWNKGDLEALAGREPTAGRDTSPLSPAEQPLPADGPRSEHRSRSTADTEAASCPASYQPIDGDAALAVVHADLALLETFLGAEASRLRSLGLQRKLEVVE